MKLIISFFSVLIISFSAQAMDKGVFFKNLKDGQSVDQNLQIEYGVKGMKVHPAGELIDGTGHFHLIIDEKPVAKGVVVPTDKNHIHYGKGQVKDSVKLKPGKRKLTLQFADGAHRSLGKDWLKTITVNVKK